MVMNSLDVIAFLPRKDETRGCRSPEAMITSKKDNAEKMNSFAKMLSYYIAIGHRLRWLFENKQEESRQPTRFAGQRGLLLSLPNQCILKQVKSLGFSQKNKQPASNQIFMGFYNTKKLFFCHKAVLLS